MGSQPGFRLRQPHQQPPPPQPEGYPRSWLRDGLFLTTDKTLLDPQAINDVFTSDLMWWNEPLEPRQMHKMLDNCMTLCVYAVPDSEIDMQRNGGRPRATKAPDCRLVGLARIVTDYVTIAYLTDVFVLEDFQRRGIASWMMRALKEMVDEWPNLRGLILMAHDKAAARLYQRELGAVDFDKGPSAGMVLLEMGGRGQKDVPNGH